MQSRTRLSTISSELYYTLLPQQTIADCGSTPDEVLNDDDYTYLQFLLLLYTIRLNVVVMKPKKAWVVYIDRDIYSGRL
jgi:hypothetical protein